MPKIENGGWTSLVENSDKHDYFKFMLTDKDELEHDSPEHYYIDKESDNTYNIGLDNYINKEEFIDMPEPKYTKYRQNSNILYEKLKLRE